MNAALLFAALIQQPAAAPQTCALLAPAGEAIVFTLVPGRGDQATFVPAEGSAWPSASAAAAQPQRARGAGLAYVAGGRGGIILNVQPPASGGRRGTAMLSRWDGRNATLPLAFGFCAPGAATPAAAPRGGTVSTSIAAFDPARGPDDCALLLGDGRRMRVDYQQGEDGTAVTLTSRELWSGRAVSGRVQHASSGGAMFETTANGPRGIEQVVLSNNGRTATRLLQFVRIGDPSGPNVNGYAICRYNRLGDEPGAE